MQAGWRITERDIAYHPRAAGTRSKVSGSVRGTLRAARGLRQGADVRHVPSLVMAKAPVPGEVKTRLGARVGHEAAAGLAAACILDTLGPLPGGLRRGVRHVAMAGDLAGQSGGRAARHGWDVDPPHAARRRLRASASSDAHDDVARAASGAPVVQIGMDTPHVSAAELAAVADRLGDRGNEAVLGAGRGRRLVGARRRPTPRSPARSPGCEMSTARTYADTLAALLEAGAAVAGTDEAARRGHRRGRRAVAAAAPGTRFAIEWARLRDGLRDGAAYDARGRARGDLRRAVLRRRDARRAVHGARSTRSCRTGCR